MQLIGVLRRNGTALLIALLVVLAGFFLVNGRGELREVGQLLSSVSLYWIAILAGLQAMVISIAAVTYKVLLRRLGYTIPWHHLAEIHLRRVLVGVVTPIGGPPSLYVFVRSLKSYGVPASESLITASSRSVASLTAFLLLMIPALLLQSPSGIITIAAVIVCVALASTIGLGVLLLRQGPAPAGIERWAPESVRGFITSARSHCLTPVDFVLPLILGLASHVTTAALLFVALQAVGHPVGVSTVLIGYVIGKLFFMVTPVFQGVGVVEFGMALALQKAGVPGAVAISAALLYRVGDLWLTVFTAALMQVARMPLLRRSVSGASTAFRQTTASLGVLATGMPVAGRRLATPIQVVVATEAILVASLWLSVTLPPTVSSVA